MYKSSRDLKHHGGGIREARQAKGCDTGHTITPEPKYLAKLRQGGNGQRCP